MAQKLNEITALHQHMYDGEASDAWEYCEQALGFVEITDAEPVGQLELFEVAT